MPVDRAAAAAVLERDRRARRWRRVAVAPLHQRDHRRPQVEALLREAVFVARRALVIEASLEHALVGERREAALEDVAGDAEIGLDLFEAAQSEEDVADDQQRPPLADHLECRGDAAHLVLVVASEHLDDKDSGVSCMVQRRYARVRFMMQRKWWVALIVCVGVFMSSLDLFIVNIAFPAIGAHFKNSSLASLSWILTSYAVVFAALLVPAGRWADAFGRKRVFLAGLAIFVTASVACALAPSVAFLVAARIAQACGAALMVPTSLGLILPEFVPHERHIAIGLWASTAGIAAAAGPPARRTARAGRLALGLPRERARRAARPGLGRACSDRATRAQPSATRPARRGGADRGGQRARGSDRQGAGLGLGFAADHRLAGTERDVAALDLAALGATRRADRGVRTPARAQLRPGGSSVAAVLRRIRRDAARGRPVPDLGVARGCADGGPDAASGTYNRDRFQRALLAPGRSRGLSNPGGDRRAAVRRRVTVVHRENGRHTGVPDELPAGTTDQRRRRRPRDSDAHGRGRVLAAARALRHRRRCAHDGSPDRRSPGGSTAGGRSRLEREQRVGLPRSVADHGRGRDCGRG